MSGKNNVTFSIYTTVTNIYSLGPLLYESFTQYVGELMSMQPKLSEKVARDRPFSFLRLVIRVIWPSSSCEHVISVYKNICNSIDFLVIKLKEKRLNWLRSREKDF